MPADPVPAVLVPREVAELARELLSHSKSPPHAEAHEALEAALSVETDEDAPARVSLKPETVAHAQANYDAIRARAEKAEAERDDLQKALDSFESKLVSDLTAALAAARGRIAELEHIVHLKNVSADGRIDELRATRERIAVLEGARRRAGDLAAEWQDEGAARGGSQEAWRHAHELTAALADSAGQTVTNFAPPPAIDGEAGFQSDRPLGGEAGPRPDPRGAQEGSTSSADSTEALWLRLGKLVSSHLTSVHDNGRFSVSWRPVAGESGEVEFSAPSFRGAVVKALAYADPASPAAASPGAPGCARCSATPAPSLCLGCNLRYCPACASAPNLGGHTCAGTQRDVTLKEV